MYAVLHQQENATLNYLQVSKNFGNIVRTITSTQLARLLVTRPGAKSCMGDIEAMDEFPYLDVVGGQFAQALRGFQ